MEITLISKPIRIADVGDGHIHPGLCRTKTGVLLVVYNEDGGGGKELLLCRSTDGGKSWSAPQAIPGICGCSIYPGSLTTLSDGRILLNWACYRDPDGEPWREPQFALSSDEGKTWTQPHSYPLENHGPSTCMRHAVAELSDSVWICPLYDHTILYDPESDVVSPFGDRRNHGLVPIVRTCKGTLISGAPQADALVPVGVPGNMVHGLRSTDGGASWQALGVFPHFGTAGYDLVVLDNDWIALTYIVYGVGKDGEFSYEIAVSRDDGESWDFDGAATIYNPQRRILGRGWPRTVSIDGDTLGTVFFDLAPEQEGGPGVFFIRTGLKALQAGSG
jgi:hypothetical protein